MIRVFMLSRRMGFYTRIGIFLLARAFFAWGLGELGRVIHERFDSFMTAVYQSWKKGRSNWLIWGRLEKQMGNCWEV
jgi:hypothetical protein